MEDATHGGPSHLGLGPAFPNPANPSVVISLSVAAEGPATVSLFNAAGQLVRVLYHGNLTVGRHRLQWDGRDEAGRPAAAGVYICRVRQGERVEAIKLVRVE